MSKFIDRLDEIHEGTPARMGFGPPRSEKTPGMALVVMVSGSHKTGAATAGGLSPDGVIVSGVSGPDQVGDIKESLGKVPWGVKADALSTSDAQAYRDGGCDLLAFGLKGTSLGAVSSEDSARVLFVDPETAAEELRDINALPVDIVIVPLSGASSDWSLEDLAKVAKVSGRLSKYILAEITEAPDAESLKVLRSAGINGLVLDLSAGEDAIKGLKAALMDMPKPGPTQRSKSNAILPGAIYSAGQAAAEEPDEDDDDE